MDAEALRWKTLSFKDQYLTRSDIGLTIAEPDDCCRRRRRHCVVAVAVTAAVASAVTAAVASAATAAGHLQQREDHECDSLPLRVYAHRGVFIIMRVLFQRPVSRSDRWRLAMAELAERTVYKSQMLSSPLPSLLSSPLPSLLAAVCCRGSAVTASRHLQQREHHVCDNLPLQAHAHWCFYHHESSLSKTGISLVPMAMAELTIYKIQMTAAVTAAASGTVTAAVTAVAAVGAGCPPPFSSPRPPAVRFSRQLWRPSTARWLGQTTRTGRLAVAQMEPSDCQQAATQISTAASPAAPADSSDKAGVEKEAAEETRSGMEKKPFLDLCCMAADCRT